MFSSNFVLEEFVLSSLKASPLIKPFPCGGKFLLV